MMPQLMTAMPPILKSEHSITLRFEVLAPDDPSVVVAPDDPEGDASWGAAAPSPVVATPPPADGPVTTPPPEDEPGAAPPLAAADEPPPDPAAPGPATCYGRDGLLGRIAAILGGDDRVLVLCGQRRIGKTRLLRELLRRLEGGDHLPIYLDVSAGPSLRGGRPFAALAAALGEALGLDCGPLDRYDADGRHLQQALLPRALSCLKPGQRLLLLLDDSDELGGDRGEGAFCAALRRIVEAEERLCVVFTIARAPGELSPEVKSLFKAARFLRVSYLEDEGALALLRAEARRRGLRLTPEAERRACALSAGHPYLLRGLCHAVGHAAGGSLADEAAVEAAVPAALESMETVFAWLFEGISPAQRIVLSVLATLCQGGEARPEPALLAALREHGFTDLAPDLEGAPALLVRTEFLRESPAGYGFRVELLRRWIALHQGPSALREHLERAVPLSERLYRAAELLSEEGDLAAAREQLHRALHANPGHVAARALLVSVLRRFGGGDEVDRALLLTARSQTAAAAARTLAEHGEQLARAGRGPEALRVYEWLLCVSPEDEDVRARYQALWRERGEAALGAGDLEAAQAFFLRAGLRQDAERVDARRRAEALQAAAEAAQAHEAAERWLQAAAIYRQLAEEQPEEQRFAEALRRVKQEHALGQRYREGQQALQRENWPAAVRALGEVVHDRATYRDALPLLIRASSRLARSLGPLGGGAARGQRSYLAAGSLTLCLAIAAALFGAGRPSGATHSASRVAPAALGASASRVQFPTVSAALSERPAPAAPRAAGGGAMVTVPAGTFLFGDDAARPGRGRRVAVAAFRIDETEVSRDDYGRCVAAGRCPLVAVAVRARGLGRAARRALASLCDSGGGSHPARCVDLGEARAYCRFVGKRLPTEVEWEYPARGSGGRRYPWGDEAPGPERLNACDGGCAAMGRSLGARWAASMRESDGFAATAPVGTFRRGQSPFGALDMAGNVSEWTETASCTAGPRRACPKRPGAVTRGGSFASAPLFVTARRSLPPRSRLPTVGFRCARDG